ncbi:hypothetical protein HDU97_004722 [Phlyctochytrium planicorne]|nr:hypothetical protein HDU97_004722 [Phlyctochytrium planicorne]
MFILSRWTALLASASIAFIASSIPNADALPSPDFYRAAPADVVNFADAFSFGDDSRAVINTAPGSSKPATAPTTTAPSSSSSSAAGAPPSATATAPPSPPPLSIPDSLKPPPPKENAFNAIAILRATSFGTLSDAVLQANKNIPPTETKATAVVVFTEDEQGLTVEAKGFGLVPNTEHEWFQVGVWEYQPLKQEGRNSKGAWIFQSGSRADISDPTGVIAGLHFNPFNRNHACRNETNFLKEEGAHAGDLGKFKTDDKGEFLVTIGPIKNAGSLKFDSKAFIVGQPVIIHELTDDCFSQPVGNAGKRFAQGVIGWRGTTKFPPAPKTIDAADVFSKSAIAVLEPTKGNTLAGTAIFVQSNPQAPVYIALDVTGFPKDKEESDHGWHVHEFGDLSTADGAANGLHFNPNDRLHACPADLADPVVQKQLNATQLHFGDIGNLHQKGGSLKKIFKLNNMSLYRGSENFVIGRALQIHANKDDCVTQKVGNAGAKLVQGIVGTRNVTVDADLFKTIGIAFNPPPNPAPPAPVTSAVGTAVATTAAATTTASAPSPIATAVAPPTFAAIAFLTPTRGNEKVKGTVTITQGTVPVKGAGQFAIAGSDTIIVEISITGLAPSSTHAIHFHEFGDITDPAGNNQFLHWNPKKVSHKCPGKPFPKNGASIAKAQDVHAGDIGNVVADANGNVNVKLTAPNIGEPTLDITNVKFVIGRGVSLHTKTDDCETDPTGDAGVRIAQGVVGWKSNSAFPLAAKTLVGRDTADGADDEDAGDEIVYEEEEETVGFGGEMRKSRREFQPVKGERNEAVALLLPVGNSTVSGVALFSQRKPNNKVRLIVDVQGLEPNTVHGFHLHSFGDLSDRLVAGLAAGGHFNPTNMNHGCIPNATRHGGDFGNFKTNKKGTATFEVKTDRLSLFQTSDNFVPGHALIIHQNQDDCKTPPVGLAGNRLAIGVVGIRNVTVTDKQGVPGLDKAFGVQDAIKIAQGIVVPPPVPNGPTSAVGEPAVATATPTGTAVVPTATGAPNGPKNEVPTKPDVVVVKPGGSGPSTATPDKNGNGDYYVGLDEFNPTVQELEHYKKLLDALLQIAGVEWGKLIPVKVGERFEKPVNGALAFLASVDLKAFHKTLSRLLVAKPVGGVSAKEVSQAVLVAGGLEQVNWEVVVKGEDGKFRVEKAILEVLESVVGKVRWGAVGEVLVEFWGWSRVNEGRKGWSKKV